MKNNTPSFNSSCMPRNQRSRNTEESVQANKPDQMTLRELKAMVPVVKPGETPKKGKLRTESEVVAEYHSDDFALTVFASGYVLAEHYDRWTVFPVHDCGAYEYEVADDDPFIGQRQTAFDEEYFLDLPWTIRITLTAEDRLAQNAEMRAGQLIAKHPDYVRDYGWLQGFTPSYEYELMRKLEWEEGLNSLTEKQREVIDLRHDGPHGKRVIRNEFLLKGLTGIIKTIPYL